jgi:hypothetical protein
MRAYEWKRFLAEGRSEFIIGVADRIRASATRPLIIGTSGGDGGHRRDNTATGLLLRAPSLDFYLHQASYGVRIPPSVGGINAVLDSYGANGKLFLTDMDHRLWTQTRSGDVRISKAVSFGDEVRQMAAVTGLSAEKTSALASAMETHQGRALVQENACMALHNLAGNASLRGRIKAAGGVELAKRAVSASDATADTKRYGKKLQDRLA